MLASGVCVCPRGLSFTSQCSNLSLLFVLSTTEMEAAVSTAAQPRPAAAVCPALIWTVLLT